jgi:hypothetical protein
MQRLHDAGMNLKELCVKFDLDKNTLEKVFKRGHLIKRIHKRRWSDIDRKRLSDSRKNWLKINCPENTFLNKVCFINNETGFIVGGNNYGFILKSIFNPFLAI